MTLALAFAAAVMLPSAAFALNYSGSQKNQATFETLEEARTNGPAAVVLLEGNSGRTFKSHPVLDGYPKGTTYIYRSPNLYGGRAAARLNTDILVFVEKSFDSKDAAQQYLKDVGLIKIIDEAIGSVILVTPANGKTFGADDQKYYYALQTAMLAQKAGEGGPGGGRGASAAPGSGAGPSGPGATGAGPLLAAAHRELPAARGLEAAVVDPVAGWATRMPNISAALAILTPSASKAAPLSSTTTLPERWTMSAGSRACC